MESKEHYDNISDTMFSESNYKMCFYLSAAHSLRRDLERFLKVFFGSSFILLVDRFLNTVRERKQERKKGNLQIHLNLWTNYSLWAAMVQEVEQICMS